MEVQINFDESSIEWRKNKNVLKNGMFSYKKSQQVCLHTEENGKRCRKRSIKGDNLCELHFK